MSILYTNRKSSQNCNLNKSYFFREWKEKVDLVEDAEKDTITFYLKDSFIFRPDLSNGLTGEEIIILPHIFIAVSVIYIYIPRIRNIFKKNFRAYQLLFKEIVNHYSQQLVQQLKNYSNLIHQC